ncbi:TPA: helix-turn-helix domain-containing protein [Salmonella enterica]|nr:helix-turn-helix domain-containing protein [Salmonella enterica subsp. enterica serovar Newport]
MNTNVTTRINPADNLKKLNDLLSVLCQSMRDGVAPTEEIETCLGIAWDLGNSAYDIILTKSSATQPTPIQPGNTLTIGARIQIARQYLGMSEDALAEMLDLTPEDISDWEDGNCPLEASYIIPLANALKCDPMWLLTGNPLDVKAVSPTPPSPVNVMKGADLANIGVRIRNRRNEMGMSVDKLADAIEVSSQLIRLWESGEVFPLSKYTDRLAKALNTSVTWLMTGRNITGEFKNQHDENIPSPALTNL